MKWSCDKGFGNDDNNDGGGSTNHGHYMKERSDVSKSLWNSGRHIITLAFHHHPDLIAIDMVPCRNSHGRMVEFECLAAAISS